jgi:hypothetical protein
MTTQEYNNKANDLNTKFPALKASVKVSPFGGRLEIEVASVDKAKALFQMYPTFNFTSGLYR